MKTKASAADEDDTEPKKIRSSRSKRRQRRHSHSSSSESPPRKRSKKHSKRIPDKKSKRSKASGGSSRRRRRRSLSPSRSHSSSSGPSSVARRSCSSCSSSGASERSVSPPPKSRSRDVRRKKGRGRDRERERKGRKVRRSVSSSSTSACSDISRSRSKSKSKSKSKSRKRRTVGGTKDGATRDKMEKDYTDRRSSRSDMNVDEDVDRDEDKLAIAKEDNDIDRYQKNLESESSPSKHANETEEIVPASGGNSDAQDLELILRHKALENFIKFRAAATMGGKTNNGAAGKDALIDDSLQNAVTKISEATHFQSQGSSLGPRHSVGSPRSQNFGNGASRPWKQENGAGMIRRAGSPGLLEPAETGGPTQVKGGMVESTHLASQVLSPMDARNGRSVMQRLAPPPGSSTSLNQRLGSSAGMSRGAVSPGLLEPAENGGPTQLKERTAESTNLASQFLSPMDAKNGRSVMQRLAPPPGSSTSLNQRLGSSAGMSRGAGSLGVLEPAENGGPTQLKGRTAELTNLASQFLSPMDAKNGRSVMQRLVPPPGSSNSINQRLGSSAGMSRSAGSPGFSEPAETGGPTQLKGRTVESTNLASQLLSPTDARNGRSVMQRLVNPPGSSTSLNQRLGSSAGLNHVNGAPRIRSVVSIPAKERFDSSTHTTPPRPIEDSSPVKSSNKVAFPLDDTNKAEGTNGENSKTGDAPASSGSVLSPAEDKSQPRIEDIDGFQKKSFSRMHDGETVEVSYKVYIPKKTPALARRKLQR